MYVTNSGADFNGVKMELQYDANPNSSAWGAVSQERKKNGMLIERREKGWLAPHPKSHQPSKLEFPGYEQGGRVSFNRSKGGVRTIISMSRISSAS